jgi:polysaccharide biosynthesis transport protein
MSSDEVIQSAPDRDRDLIDLRALGQIARRRIKAFLITAFLISLLGFLFLTLIPNSYTATSSVLIDRRKVEVTDVSSVLSGLPADSASVDTEVQVLKSPQLVARVVKRLKLDQNPEFNKTLQTPGMMQSAAAWVKSLTSPAKKASGSPVDAVTANVIENLDVTRRGLTYVIGVSFKSESPKVSADVANAVSEEYLAAQVNEKRAAAQEAQGYLSSRLSGLGADVQGKEAAAEALRARAGLSNSNNTASFDEQVIQDISRQSVTLSSELADKRARLAAALGARNNPSALPAVLESNTIRDLKVQRGAALAKNLEISSRYGPLHPETAKAREQLVQIDREMASEMRQIVAGLSNDVNAAQSRLGTINSALNRQQRAAVSTSRDTARVSQIEREAMASRTIYEDFLKRSKETSASVDLAKADGAIISRAVYSNSPSSPNRLLLLLLIGIAAAAAGVISAIVAELLDVKISSGDDAERHLQLSRIASIPGIKKANDGLSQLIINKPLSGYSEAYRALGSYVMKEPSDDQGAAKVIMVTSALPHEGKTTVTTSLALSIGCADERVLLIDSDLRRPQVAASLGISCPKADIHGIVANTSPLRSNLTKVTGSNVDVLLIGDKAHDVEIFRSDVFAKFLKKVRSQYDYILIDTAPVLAMSDPRHIARLADSVLFVCRWRRTSRYAARAAVSVLRDADAPLVGVILNAVNLKKQSLYSNDDSLSFYKDYSHYYTE